VRNLMAWAESFFPPGAARTPPLSFPLSLAIPRLRTLFSLRGRYGAAHTIRSSFWRPSGAGSDVGNVLSPSVAASTRSAAFDPAGRIRIRGHRKGRLLDLSGVIL